MPSFTRFLLTFVHDPTPYGDLARDVKDDSSVELGWGYRDLKRHIAGMDPIPVVLTLLDEVHVMHKFSKIASSSSSSL